PLQTEQPRQPPRSCARYEPAPSAGLICGAERVDRQWTYERAFGRAGMPAGQRRRRLESACSQSAQGTPSMQLVDILRTAHEHGASDIHLVSGHVPMMRVNTVMTPMDFPVLTPSGVLDGLKLMLSEEQQKRFAEVKDLDFSYQVPELCRYRVNAHM